MKTSPSSKRSLSHAFLRKHSFLLVRYSTANMFTADIILIKCNKWHSYSLISVQCKFSHQQHRFRCLSIPQNQRYRFFQAALPRFRPMRLQRPYNVALMLNTAYFPQELFLRKAQGCRSEKPLRRQLRHKHYLQNHNRNKALHSMG